MVLVPSLSWWNDPSFYVFYRQREGKGLFVFVTAMKVAPATSSGTPAEEKRTLYYIWINYIIYECMCMLMVFAKTGSGQNNAKEKIGGQEEEKQKGGGSWISRGSFWLLCAGATHIPNAKEKNRDRERERELRVGNWISRGNLIPKRTERLAEQIQTRDEELVAQQRLKRLQLTFNT